jgi:hypothetical protein
VAVGNVRDIVLRPGKDSIDGVRGMTPSEQAHRWMNAVYPGWHDADLRMYLWASCVAARAPDTWHPRDGPSMTMFLEDAYLAVTNATPQKPSHIEGVNDERRADRLPADD